MTVFSNPMLTEVDLARVTDDGLRHELRAGLLLAEPADRSVTVYRPLVPPRRLASEELLDGAEVLPGLSIQVAALFEP
jgi:hypothetical protein